MNIAPFVALQATYIMRKNRKIRQCENCPHFKGLSNKCKKGYIPEYDWRICPHNDY